MPIVVMTVIVVFVCGPLLYLLMRAFGRAAGMAQMREFARARGWAFTPIKPFASWRFDATVAGVPVVVDSVFRGRAAPPIGRAFGRAPLPTSARLVVGARGAGDPPRGIAEPLPAVAMGDAAFDRVYAVESSDANVARAIVDATIRAAFLAHPNHRLDLEIVGGVPTIRWFPAGLELVDPACALLAHLYGRASSAPRGPAG